VPILVLHKASGRITVESGRIDEYASRGGLQMVPAILDGDVCVKLLRYGEWIATAQFV
jgi:hypothetical protein